MKSKCCNCGKEYELKTFGNGVYERELEVPTCDCQEKINEFKERVSRRGSLKYHLQKIQLPKRQKYNRFKNITCEYIKDAKDFCKSFKSHKSKGLFLIGQAGNGKTTLACCIAKELFMQRAKVLFLTFADCLNKMHEASSYESNKNVDDLINHWAMYDLLIIDDFGRENYTGKRLENTFLFFDRLYNECTTIIVTANPENIAKLKKIIEFNAIFDRLAEQTKVLKFNNKSFRRNNEGE